MSLSERDSYDSRVYVLSHISWNVRLTIVSTKDDSVTLLQAELFSGIRVNLSPCAPHSLRDRICQLLHPWLVSRATIEGLH
jgi:hypothetical protein